MALLKKYGKIALIVLGCFVLANVISLPSLYVQNMLQSGIGFAVGNYLKWTIFFFIIIMLLCNVIFSHKFTQGRGQEILFFISISLLISILSGYILYCLIQAHFKLTELDWLGFLKDIIDIDFTYYGIVFGIFVGFVALYGGLIDRKMFAFFRSGLRGSGKLNQVEDSNLENSRWMTDQERDKIFKRYKYSQLSGIQKDGIPVMAKLTSRNKDMDVVFNSPCHSLIIGSTGSGKTTTFVSPMIQLLGACGAGSSMIMTDPKGELFSLHSGYLTSRGYDVKVIDLRDTYSSYRWNPLESIWDNYTGYREAYKKAKVRHGDAKVSKLKLVGDKTLFNGLNTWYEFEGKAFSTYNDLLQNVKLFKKKIFDEVYEDLNDLVSVLIPIENEKDPMWEKGARAITLAVLLAMLEDSEKEELHFTKEKFNFFNMTKILQNSTEDYLELRKYFLGRSPLSKAKSLSKQVCDAATQTRASYMSIVYEKLTMFNDAGICALTSSSDFSAVTLAERPTALFLKIPDEKDTRHNLAAIFILNIYKTLIKVASATEELTLPRNVYFIMDEFGNMPKIEKFDKFITVGRSRKIWFNMIIQSYAQLNNVYGDTVADIVKGNCGIKMFIGSNDMNTCKEYSELCGNITVVTTSTSGSAQSKDVNISSQTQVRPLIYPSELQRLNAPGDIGHSIIVTFGNYPLMTYFSPSFKVPFYKMGKMDTEELNERFFDENASYYDISIRNELMESNSNEKKDASATGSGNAAEKSDNAQPTTEEEKTKQEKTEQSKTQSPEGKKNSLTAENLLEVLKKNSVIGQDATIKDLYNVIEAMKGEEDENK